MTALALTPFQVVAVAVLGAIVCWEVWELWQRPFAPWAAVLRIVVWLAAAVAIAQPELPQAIATLLGIRRAADLVSYLFALAFLVTSFYFYSRSLRLERQITRLARHLTLLEARDAAPLGRPAQGSASTDRTPRERAPRDGHTHANDTREPAVPPAAPPDQPARRE